MGAERQQVVLDVDTGIDDALAILWLAAQPTVELVAAGSVHGNIDARRAARNTLRVLEVCGRAAPVALGAAQPLAQPLRTAWMVHGADGLGEVDEPPPSAAVSGEHAAAQIVRLGAENPGRIDLLALGPLTNLALALRRDPDALARYRRVVVMGGSGPEGPEWQAQAMDANIDHDPEAADIVFSARADLTMVGTNLEPYLGASAERLRALESAGHAHATFAWRILQYYVDVHERWGGRRMASLWDPLAAALLVDPSLIDASAVCPVDVVHTDRGFRAGQLTDRRGQARFDPRPDVEVVTAVDAERFLAGFLEALCRPLPVQS